MRELEPPFEILFEGKTAKVTEHEIRSRRVFHIDYDGWKRPLNITVALKDTGEKFWTSIPEGRQTEAEVIGKLVGLYIRNKAKG